MTPPRIHVLPAERSPVAVVMRRGPSRWWHVLRWTLAPPGVEPGAWFHGRLYPRRCALSPGGDLLGYFALGGGPPPWDAYLAVSKVPWLSALAAWHVGNTWYWGCEFLPDGRFAPGDDPPGPPTSGSYPAGLAPPSPPRTIAHPDRWRGRDVQQELRRGWLEDTAARQGLVLRRPQPGSAEVRLVLIHSGHDFAEPGVEGAEIGYALDRGGEATPLPEIAWADWDGNGRLLVATRSGELRIAELTGAGLETTWAFDLSTARPDPTPAPQWAASW